MSLPLLLAVGALGGCGAIARFLLDGLVSRRAGRGLPTGTFAVNVSAALLLGIVAGQTLGTTASAILGTGFLGGYSTFSTWMFESHRLAEDGRRRHAAANVAIGLVAGAAAFWLGRSL